MSAYLGHRRQTGFLDAQNPRGAGFWTVRWRPQDLYPGAFEVYHAALQGPGGNFWVYLDDVFYSAAVRGDINEYDPIHPMFVRAGQTISFYWSIGSGTAPTVTLFAQQPREAL